MNSLVIDAVVAAGFDVWMRSPNDTWMIFTDGENLGYLQEDRTAGFSISTVHRPNTTVGTGFQIERHIPSFTKEMLAQAFVSCPHWHRGLANAIRKYRGIEDYRSESSFNEAYRLIAKGKR